MTELTNLIKNHTGKWYEVVVYAKFDDDPGEIIAKFTSGLDAVTYATKQKESGIYVLVVVR